MKIINASYEILTSIDNQKIFKQIEQIARTCYKSENKIDENSSVKMIQNLIKNKHEAMLEHYSFSVKFIVDRGVSHELVRHRLASFAQESTRYCNYSKEKFSKEITFIKPCFFENENNKYGEWKFAMMMAENHYFELIEMGATPQEARTVLPNSLKTEIVVTMNLREWRHFFNLRAAGTTGKPHPQMLEVTVPLLKEIKKKIPIIFDDINEDINEMEL